VITDDICNKDDPGEPGGAGADENPVRRAAEHPEQGRTDHQPYRPGAGDRTDPGPGAGQGTGEHPDPERG